MAFFSGLKGMAISAIALAFTATGVIVAASQPNFPIAAAVPAEELAREAEVNSRNAERAELLAAAEERHATLDTQAQAITETEEQILAEREAAEEERLAFIETYGYTPETTNPPEIARQIMANKWGWGDDQFACYNSMIMRESRWIVTADNPTSSAYGIPQALPGKKMASAGADWETNAATQIKWGLGYVKDRYGTPCGAWSFWQSHHWY